MVDINGSRITVFPQVIAKYRIFFSLWRKIYFAGNSPPSHISKIIPSDSERYILDSISWLRNIPRICSDIETRCFTNLSFARKGCSTNFLDLKKFEREVGLILMNYFKSKFSYTWFGKVMLIKHMLTQHQKIELHMHRYIVELWAAWWLSPAV